MRERAETQSLEPTFLLEHTLLSIFIFFSTVSSIEGLAPAILYPDGAICLRYLVTHNFILISAHLEEAAITARARAHKSGRRGRVMKRHRSGSLLSGGLSGSLGPSPAKNSKPATDKESSGQEMLRNYAGWGILAGEIPGGDPRGPSLC